MSLWKAYSRDPNVKVTHFSSVIPINKLKKQYSNSLVMYYMNIIVGNVKKDIWRIKFGGRYNEYKLWAEPICIYFGKLENRIKSLKCKGLKIMCEELFM